MNGELNSTSTDVVVHLTKDKLLLHHIDTPTKSNIEIDKIDLPTFYWLSKLHQNPYKSRFISSSSPCSTTILSNHITYALTAVKDRVIKYTETALSNYSNVNYLGPLKTLLRSSKSCGCETFRVLKFILSIFIIYTHPSHMISSKQKCCLLFNGV